MTQLQPSFLGPPSYNTPEIEMQGTLTAPYNGPAAQQSAMPHGYYQIPQEDVALNPAQYVTVG